MTPGGTTATRVFCFLEELKNLRAGGEGGGKGEDAHKCLKHKLWQPQGYDDFCVQFPSGFLWSFVSCVPSNVVLFRVPYLFSPKIPFTTFHTGPALRVWGIYVGACVLLGIARLVLQAIFHASPSFKRSGACA